MKLVAAVASAITLAVGGAALVPVLVVAAAASLPAGPPFPKPPGPPPVGSRGPLLPARDIPPAMEVLYVTAARRCPGLPWTVLAAIGKVESDHGRGSERSAAGAEGPMQFLPTTWARYGVDGDGDGVASIWDPADAVPAAADYLCANGAGRPSGLGAAIYQYNHDDSYVRAVLAIAATYEHDEVSG